MSVKKEQNSVSERARQLLKALVETYIKEGSPVGSKTLADQLENQLSSATIRNVMVELEERGFIRSMHTSSGRIPTALGYRFFVDSLLTMRPLSELEVSHLKLELEPQLPTGVLVQTVSRLLSRITHLAGVVTLPKRERFTLRHIEFLSLSMNRVLVILVVNEVEVQNCVIQCEEGHSASELQQAANFFNAEFSGQEIGAIRQFLISDLEADKSALDAQMKLAIDLAKGALEETSVDCVVEGEENVLEMMTVASSQHMKELLAAFLRKQEMLRLLDKCLMADGIQIFIGAESGYQVFDDCALVTAPYKTGDYTVGALGVIGPARMPYERVIPLVDVTAKLVSLALTRSRFSK